MRDRRCRFRTLLPRVGLVVFMVLSAQAIPAQDRAGSPAIDMSWLEDAPGAAPQSYWGTLDASIHALNAWDFHKIVDSQTWNFTTANYRYRTSAVANSLFAGFHLPTGARLTRMAVEACDNSTAASVLLLLERCPAGSPALCTTAGVVSTGNTPAPGCAVYSVDLTAANIVIDNTANSYFLAAATGTSDTSTTFRGVRLYYKLQVSPAPPTATFPNDVPTTHPVFQFVEALARAGITGGCGPGSYCPDSPLTRGQMAVFLSVALGLHWPN